jgi:hypothetical protein
VFISSSAYESTINGVAKADGFCQGLADAKGLGGMWKAWLSDTSASASMRLTHAKVPYLLLNGTKVAESWADLTDGAINHPIDVDEGGHQLPGTAEVWTGSDTAGATLSDLNCSNWSTTSSPPNAMVGNLTTSWTAAYERPCDYTGATAMGLHLYCFEQGTPAQIPSGTQTCPSDFKLGDPAVPTARGGGGGAAYNDFCYPGHVLVGFNIYENTGSPDVVGQIEAICGTVTITPGSCQLAISPKETLTKRGTTSNAAPVTQKCPLNQVIVGYQGRWGANLDQVGFGCAPLALTNDGSMYQVSVGSPITWFSPVGGSAPPGMYKDVCPSGQVGVGTDTHAQGVILAFGLYCANPILVAGPVSDAGSTDAGSTD